jgi:transposase InsO family protein
MSDRAPQRYHRYDTALICLFALGKEQLVPDHLRALVPHSTASSWRKRDVDALVGGELRALHEEALDLHQLLARHQRLRRTVIVLARVWANISDAILPTLHKQKQHFERVADAVQQLFTIMPRARAFRVAGLSSSAFHDRLAQIRTACGISPLQRCFKRHPLQLALREVEQIKALHRDPGFACWPGCSLYFEGLQRRSLHIARSTYYKYVKLLGLKRPRLKPQRKTAGLRASKPNEYLHIDTTFWPIHQGKAAVVFVSDNFSKAILGSQAATSKHAVHVAEALRQAIATIQFHHPENIQTTLVADGGSENHNALVDGLLASVSHPLISKVIALKDVVFSNSSIEGVNRIFKQYLRYYAPTTLASVQRVMELFIHDYGSRRPHGSLNGLRPIDLYIDPTLSSDQGRQIQHARSIRIQENMALNCSVCTLHADVAIPAMHEPTE